jgi:hypothetical protein
MATPNSRTFEFDEFASLTIAEYSDDIADNVTNNIPTWAMFKDEGAIDECDGGTVLTEQLDFADNATFKWFSGYEVLSITPTECIGSAVFDWKECNANVVFNRREIAINSGGNKRHDLVRSKTTNAERTIINNLGAGVYALGTESDGKIIGGIQHIIADDPTTGTVGGINRATAGNEWWRNQVFDEGTDSITLSSTTIQRAMELLWVRLTRGMDVPNLWSYGNTYWTYFADSVNVNQRYVRSGDGDKAQVSFPYYVFKNGCKVFHDPNAGATRGYAMNTKFMKLRPHSDRNIKTEKARYPANSTATVVPIDWMGNLVCSNASLQGVMHP